MRWAGHKKYTEIILSAKPEEKKVVGNVAVGERKVLRQMLEK
jgi:hypothetical protein